MLHSRCSGPTHFVLDAVPALPFLDPSVAADSGKKGKATCWAVHSLFWSTRFLAVNCASVFPDHCFCSHSSFCLHLSVYCTDLERSASGEIQFSGPGAVRSLAAESNLGLNAKLAMPLVWWMVDRAGFIVGRILGFPEKGTEQCPRTVGGHSIWSLFGHCFCPPFWGPGPCGNYRHYRLQFLRQTGPRKGGLVAGCVGHSWFNEKLVQEVHSSHREPFARCLRRGGFKTRESPNTK